MPEVHVVMVEPEIHWNTGNAGRTCLAAGAKLHLVGPLGFSLESHQVKRAGLDYWPLVDPVIWRDFETFEAALPALGTPIFVTPDGPRTIWDVQPEGDVVLLFGKESVGFSADVRARYRDHAACIPMQSDAVRSINVSTCVGIVLYEVLRQRSYSVSPLP